MVSQTSKTTQSPSMATDTALRAIPDGYTGQIALRWNNHGRPVGAILAGMMARAAAEESGMRCPVTHSVVFLEPATVGPVHLRCKMLRKSSSLAAVSVVAAQGGRPIARSRLWLMGSVPPAEISDPAPDVPDPADVPTIEDRVGEGFADYGGCLMQRPLAWTDDYANRPTTRPHGRQWLTCIPVAHDRDAVTILSEFLVAGDLLPPLMGGVALPEKQRQLSGAQTIELNGRIGNTTGCSTELLVDVSCSLVTARTLVADVRIWSADRAFRGSVAATYRLPRLLG